MGDGVVRMRTSVRSFVGLVVGALVGDWVELLVGRGVVGAFVGDFVGLSVGREVVGDSVGGGR
jgi:hypothetical protein